MICKKLIIVIVPFQKEKGWQFVHSYPRRQISSSLLNCIGCLCVGKNHQRGLASIMENEGMMYTYTEKLRLGWPCVQVEMPQPLGNPAVCYAQNEWRGSRLIKTQLAVCRGAAFSYRHRGQGSHAL